MDLRNHVVCAALFFVVVLFSSNHIYALRVPAQQDTEPARAPFRVNLQFGEGQRLYTIRSTVTLPHNIQDELDGILDVVIREQHRRHLWTLSVLAETLAAFLWFDELQSLAYARANIELSPDEWDLAQFIMNDCAGSWRDPASQKRRVVEYIRHARWWPREVAAEPRDETARSATRNDS
jgi:hypothetical protein